MKPYYIELRFVSKIGVVCYTAEVLHSKEFLLAAMKYTRSTKRWGCLYPNIMQALSNLRAETHVWDWNLTNLRLARFQPHYHPELATAPGTFVVGGEDEPYLG